MPAGPRSKGTPSTPWLSPRHRSDVERCFEQLIASSHWHGRLPVLLLERCWLRLSVVPVEDLARRLPPDSSRDAPELVHYRQLVQLGHSPLAAEQLCWLEFGPEACRAAQRRLWLAHERGDDHWTLDHYLDLLRQYRRRFGARQTRALPLLILARADGGANGSVHELVWLGGGEGEAMRHTCP